MVERRRSGIAGVAWIKGVGFAKIGVGGTQVIAIDGGDTAQIQFRDLLGHGPSMRNHRITISAFRPCSTCKSHSQAPLCYCTPRTVTKRAEGTFESLRYSFGGDHPSQTTHHALFSIRWN